MRTTTSLKTPRRGIYNTYTVNRNDDDTIDRNQTLIFINSTPVFGLMGTNPKLFVSRSECFMGFMIVQENQIG